MIRRAGENILERILFGFDLLQDRHKIIVSRSDVREKGFMKHKFTGSVAIPKLIRTIHVAIHTILFVTFELQLIEDLLTSMNMELAKSWQFPIIKTVENVEA